ncbi:MAG: hypothetical protein PUI10_05335 [Prevotellaceae bacterium]|nr:hypothetical protein [Prevotellaceae bacterium]
MERDRNPDFLAGTGAMAVSGKTKASLQKEKEGRGEQTGQGQTGLML